MVRFGSPRGHRLWAWAIAIMAIVGCAPAASAPASPTRAEPTPSSTADPPTVILVGTIVTMDDPPRAEAIAYRDGEVMAVGPRDEVLALAGDQTRIIELGSNVAYPGFIDAHAHWIGDREVMGIATAEEAMEAALVRGWTSIAELWVDGTRVNELQRLADEGALPLRVDGYLALNLPAPSGEHLGDWYLSYEPGEQADRLRVGGVKITLDNGWCTQFWWEPQDLADAIGRADSAGWQVAVHTVSSEAHDSVLAAYEAALGGEPNLLHHRIDHAIQVTDAQLARMVDLEIATVVHLDGAASDWMLETDYLGNLGEDTRWLARWRDFVDAGVRIAGATDAPWLFPGFALTDDIGRPLDQVAGGMDGAGRQNPDTPEWVLAQLLTAEQGLRAVTIDAAYALGDEDRRGHLAPGAYADITILSGDVTSAGPDEIREMAVVATIVGGVTEHCADPAVCP